MRAIQIVAFKGPEGLRLGEVARPKPRAGEVLVRVVYCGVNPVDRSQATGRWQWVTLPHTPGSEIAGIVEEVGEGVAGVGPGDRVAVAFRVFCGRCDPCLQGRDEACVADPRSAEAPIMVGLPSEGGFADYVIAPACNALLVPPGVSLEAACVATLDGVTAWHEIERADLRAGEHVLVTGATGGLGTLFIQMAKLRGAIVYALSGTAALTSTLKDLGADEVIVRGTEDVVQRVHDLTDGSGVQVVLDSLGGGMLSQNLACLAPLGRLAFCGILTGATAEVNLASFYARQLQLVGSTGGSRRDLRQVLDAMARGAVKPIVWRHFPLQDAAEAMEALSKPGRLGKVLLDVSPAP
ncbi:MAG: zinc-binding dehydrogenase [Chloroflexi bacterium]|nr:zinc-binding dehydrogenase [Chloroflexota bacterium]